MYVTPRPQAQLHTGNAARDLVHHSNLPVLLFVLAHIPLALLMRQSALIATLHAIATVVIGVVWTGARGQPERTVYVVAYITGAEVLWRMTGARVFWEFGKYAIVLFALLAMLRQRKLAGPFLPIAYFVLLLPSIVLTLLNMSFSDARGQISFNLSGPFALLVSAWFFSQLRLTPQHIRRLLLMLVIPVLGIATIAFYNTLSATSIKFTDESNFVTSGGFGPNQVSALLGLGALGCLWYALDPRSSRSLRSLMLIMTGVLATQSALTFSRGGLYTAGGSAALAALFLARDSRVRIRMVMVTILLYIFAAYLVVPGLDAFTEGTFSQRFSDTNPTARDTLVENDLQVWFAHPLFGVGPGMAGLSRAQAYLGNRALLDQRTAAHTEFARMLSEHGTFGLVALILMMLMALRNVSRQRPARNRALVVLLITWSLLFMFESAMRVVAPALLFGLSFATFEAQEQQFDE